MKKIILSLALVGTLACSKEENAQPAGPKVTPSAATAAFTAQWNVAAEQENITFTNASKNAVRYEWDFGDGQASIATSPTIKYPSKGTYTVRLLAYDAEGKASTLEQTIKVGKRYVKEIKLAGLSFVNNWGLPWDDDGTGPDVSLRYSLPQGWVGTVPLSNLQPAQLPFTSSFTTLTLGNREIVPGRFDLLMVDMDGPGSFSAYDVMYQWKTTDVPAPVRDELGRGTYTFQGPVGSPGPWNVVVSYETLL
ncbi:PKD domain-containing protein [Hymenobacter persicinus]|uniref:PKD domain-containing protein n=1 Tax=Hymenobacter persicinus TaxID=2025506 RepID=A0A4V1ZAH7_9BACT|nr:PKD domain-containing protein [Hymenobacter persicinus]RYU78171.1 PKD domain-containing protein [Hymenobacter persicinus]